MNYYEYPYDDSEDYVEHSIDRDSMLHDYIRQQRPRSQSDRCHNSSPDGQWVCTLEKRHDGNYHVAHSSQELVGIWRVAGTNPEEDDEPIEVKEGEVYDPHGWLEE